MRSHFCGFAINSNDPSTTIMGAAAAAGDITTKDTSILLFNNTFLFDFPPNGAPLVPGFHDYDFQEPNKVYAMAFVSWISPGLFLPPFDWLQDVTALSHELAEIMNDPIVGHDLVHNITPWWLAPNGFCSNLLEVGDPLDFIPNATFSITMNGMTYHPENVVLAPWFKRESPSSALHNAYTYPNESLITNLSPPQKPNCQ
jgi:hypothetical protein